jgi:hypothetical protein
MRNQLRTIRLIVADRRAQPAPGAMTNHVDDAVVELPLAVDAGSRDANAVTQDGTGGGA